LNNKILKIAFIGMGRMGVTHFSILNSHPNVEIIAIVEPSKIIKSFFKRYKPNIKIYSNYTNFFDDLNVDAVIISTPPDSHFEICKLAAANSVNVFCEKPFTISFNESNEISNLFSSKNLINQVGYVNRYNDIFTYVKKNLEKGLIGDILSFKSQMFSGTKIKKSSKLSWRDNSKRGGGALYEMASHAIDLVNFLLTKPDKVIGSILKPIYSSNVEDFVNSTFIYKNGITGLLEVNWSDKSYRKPTNKIEIFGNKGKLIADQHSIKIFLNKSSDMFELKSGWNTIYITDLFNQCKFYVRGNEFTNQLYHFIENILDSKSKPLSNFNNASITHKVIEEIIIDHNNNNDEKN
tara:strand:+ start:1853 stop:2902 length:1050 start_codon:yes stop_codon:yes gene_type:complete